MFYEIAETFIQYINTLTADEIEQLDADFRSNGLGGGEGGGVKSIVEIKDCIELLKLLQLFYYFNGKFSLSNGTLKNPKKTLKEETVEFY